MMASVNNKKWLREPWRSIHIYIYIYDPSTRPQTEFLEFPGSSQEAPRRLPRGSPEAPSRPPRRPPEGSQDTARATKAPRAPWKKVGSFCIVFYNLFCKSSICLQLCERFLNGDDSRHTFKHKCSPAAVKGAGAQSRPLSTTVRTPSDKSDWGTWTYVGKNHIYIERERNKIAIWIYWYTSCDISLVFLPLSSTRWLKFVQHVANLSIVR